MGFWEVYTQTTPANMNQSEDLLFENKNKVLSYGAKQGYVRMKWRYYLTFLFHTYMYNATTE